MKWLLVIVHMLVTFLMLIRISLMLLHYHHSYGQPSKYYHCLLRLAKSLVSPTSQHLRNVFLFLIIRNHVRSFIFCPTGIPIQGTVLGLMQLTAHGGFVCTSSVWSWVLFGSPHASTISWWVPLGISFASRIFVDLIFSIRQIIWETLSNDDIEMFTSPFSYLCCSLGQWCCRHV